MNIQKNKAHWQTMLKIQYLILSNRKKRFFSKFCLQMISRLVFLGSLNHIETGFSGLQIGFFGISSGGYREMGEAFCLGMTTLASAAGLSLEGY